MHEKTNWRLTAGMAAVFAWTPPIGGGALRAQSARPRPSPTATATALEGAPFNEGESLEYRVSWNGFLTAATVQIQARERREISGRATWHFQAVAHTVEPVRYLYPLDDQFDSYSDAATLAGMQFEMYLSEKNKRETQIIRMSADGEPAADGKPMVRVLPGTRDPLGVLFALRATDWRSTNQIEMPVYDGKKAYTVKARGVGERVEAVVPAGKFSATRVQLLVFERGRELSDVRIWVWLANDAARTPVLIEASLPFGDLRVQLIRTAR